MSGGRRSRRSRPARGSGLTRLHANDWRRPLRSSPRTSSSITHPRAGNPRRCPPRGAGCSSRDPQYHAPTADTLAGGRVVQADITELGRPSRDETQSSSLGGSVSFVSTGFKHWENFTVGSVSFVRKVIRRFAFCGGAERAAALPPTRRRSSKVYFFFF